MDERTCTIPGCSKRAKPGYREAVCGMHRERIRLHGSADNPRERQQRLLVKGYWYAYDPAHPLALRNGYVAEHRVALWEKLGRRDACCYWCGKHVRWIDQLAGLVVDHVDNDPANNDPANLVPACCGCNWGRSVRQKSECSNGHSLSGDNLYISTDRYGVRRRRCRACARDRQRIYSARKRAA